MKAKKKTSWALRSGGCLSTLCHLLDPPLVLQHALHACDIKFMGINVCGTCLISENREHLKYTRYMVDTCEIKTPVVRSTVTV